MTSFEAEGAKNNFQLVNISHSNAMIEDDMKRKKKKEEELKVCASNNIFAKTSISGHSFLSGEEKVSQTDEKSARSQIPGLAET